MSDTITLPREVVEKALEAFNQHRFDALTVAEEREYERHAEALRTALAAPKQEHFAILAIACKDKEIDRLTDENEALRRDAERYKWVLGWLVRTGLLSCKACRIDTPESYGNWWILRKPWSIDDGSFVAYGADLKDTIDAAIKGDKR